MMHMREGLVGYLTVDEDGRYPQEVRVVGAEGTLVYAPAGELDDIPWFYVDGEREAIHGNER